MPARSWWVQIGTSQDSGCATDAWIYAELRGRGKSSGWSDHLSSQHSWNNFERGDVAIYELTCGSASCPHDVDLEEVCLRLETGLVFGSSWCPFNIRVFSKPEFEPLGIVSNFPRFSLGGDEVICRALEAPLSLPAPSAGAGVAVSHVAFWADFGFPRDAASEIIDVWPMSEGLNTEGAFSLYDGFRDWVVNQGNLPDALFLLGDIGYVGGAPDKLQKVVEGIVRSGGGHVEVSKLLPSLGNHDVNGPTGCVNYDVGRCFYGNNHIFWQSQWTEGFGFSEWNQSWFDAFPGLHGKQVIIPPSTGPVKWAAPYRYNVDLGPDSLVYFVVGLVSGSTRVTWAPEQPDVAHPVSGDLMKGLSSDASGNEIECDFIRDSLAHGRHLGKRVFVYLSHDGPQPVSELFSRCDDVYAELDLWLFGHEHFMNISVPRLSNTTQESQRGQPPIRFLLGNGGFDEGLDNAVGFVSMREYHEGNRIRLHFQAYDTCISETNCPWGALLPPVQLASCWRACLNISGGYNSRRAVPNKEGFAFIYDAPRI